MEPTIHQKFNGWLRGVRDQDPQSILDQFQCFYELDLGDGLKTVDSLERDHPGHVAFTNAKFNCVMQMVDSVYPDGLDGKTCLDIACNCGIYSFALAERSMKWGLGVDNVHIWVQLAIYLQHLKGRNDSHMATIDFRQGDFYDLSFPNDMFDLVLCLGFLYHTTDLLGACKRLSRWTGETLVVQTRVVAVDGAVARLGDTATQEFITDKEFSIVPSKDLVTVCLKRAGFDRVEEWYPEAETTEAKLLGDDPTNLFLIAYKKQ